LDPVPVLRGLDTRRHLSDDARVLHEGDDLGFDILGVAGPNPGSDLTGDNCCYAARTPTPAWTSRGRR